MIPLTVEIITEGDVALTVRQQRRVTTAVHKAVGERWRDRFLRLHFLPQARGRYSYQRRSQATLKKKLRLAAIGKVQDGGTTDLVWSGRLKAAMMGWHRVSASPSRSTVHMIGPNYLSINYKPGRPHLANEILAVIASEERELQETADKTMGKETAAAAQETRRRQTRGSQG